MAIGDDGALLRRLVACAPAAIVVVDREGTITFANEGVEGLFGRAAGQLVGTDLVDHVDADWNPVGVATIGAAMQVSGPREPVLLRLRPPGRPPVVVELTANGQTADRVVDGVVAYIRPWDERWLLDRALDSLAGDRPLEETLQLLVEAAGAAGLRADGAVLWEPRGGRFERSVASPGLTPAQAGVGAPRRAGVPPWVLAQRADEPVVVGTADLGDERLRADAEAAGHRWCLAFPVPGRDGVQACLVLWRRSAEGLDDAARSVVKRLVRLAELVLERSRPAAELRRVATHDALTGLANRARFLGVLGDALERPASPQADTIPHLVGVLSVDLDGLGPVHDRYGHGVGDEALRAVAHRLEHTIRAGDLVARLGDDELAVLCPDVADASDLHVLAGRIIDVVGAPVCLGDVDVRVGASVGVVAAAPGACSTQALVEAAVDARPPVERGGPGAWAEGHL